MWTVVHRELSRKGEIMSIRMDRKKDCCNSFVPDSVTLLCGHSSCLESNSGIMYGTAGTKHALRVQRNINRAVGGSQP